MEMEEFAADDLIEDMTYSGLKAWWENKESLSLDLKTLSLAKL